MTEEAQYYMLKGYIAELDDEKKEKIQQCVDEIKEAAGRYDPEILGAAMGLAVYEISKEMKLI